MSNEQSELKTLKPQYFVTRQNGSMVPLIAMDELPPHVRIGNVSRNLSAWDIAGMTGVGVAPTRHEFYVVEGINNAVPIVAEGNKGGKPQAEQTTSSPVGPEPHSCSSEAAPDIRVCKLASNQSMLSNVEEGRSYGVEEQAVLEGASSVSSPSLLDMDIPMDSSTPKEQIPVPIWRESPVTNVAPTHGRKTHCAYWMRKGECDFAQAGCIYKHEMPTDLAGLHAVGLQDLPKWYRERYGKGSLLVAGGKSKPSHGIQDQNWRQASVVEEVFVKRGRGGRAYSAFPSARPIDSPIPWRKSFIRNSREQSILDFEYNAAEAESDKETKLRIKQHEAALNAAALHRDNEVIKNRQQRYMTGSVDPKYVPAQSRRIRATRGRRSNRETNIKCNSDASSESTTASASNGSKGKKLTK